MITLPNDTLAPIKWGSLLLMMLSAYYWWGNIAPFFVFGVWAFLNTMINTLCIYITSTGLILNATMQLGMKKDESKTQNIHG